MDTKKVQKKTISTYLKQGFSYIMKYKMVVLSGLFLTGFFYFQNNSKIEKSNYDVNEGICNCRGGPIHRRDCYKNDSY